MSLFSIACCIALVSTTCITAAELTRNDIPSDVAPELRQLIEKTFSKSTVDRVAAIKAIGAMGGSAGSAVPFLLRARSQLDLENFQDREDCVEQALVAIGEPAIDACLKHAKNYQNRHRVYAIFYLRKFDSSRAAEGLLELLKSSDSEGRGLAAEAFQEVRYPPAVPVLINYMKEGNSFFNSTSDRESRYQRVIKALGCQRAGLNTLLEIMNNKDEGDWLRGAAAHSVGQISEPSAYPKLIDVFQDRTLPSYFRAGAARGIGAYRPALSMPEIANNYDFRDSARILHLFGTALKDENESFNVRIAITKALGEINDARAMALLNTIVDSHPKDPLGFWAAINLVEINDKQRSGQHPLDHQKLLEVFENYRPEAEGDGVDIAKRREAIKKLAHQPAAAPEVKATSWSTVVLCIALVIAAAAGGLLVLQNLRSRTAADSHLGENI